ncbi:MAG TPA: hypothetical protein VNE58_10335 [Casimicrobiaceae bacterium]|nr:hypothetical protein [Casimicrobiaceae bacterium]
MPRTSDEQALLPTLDDTVGPYFPPSLVARDHLDLYRPYVGLTPRVQGSPIRLRVRLLDIDRRPATGALLEIWQANARGFLRVPGAEADLNDDPYFQGYGRVYSAAGEFEIKTVMPGATRVDSITRAPFITLTIFSDGIARLVTQVFFEGHALNEIDPLRAGLPLEVAQRLVAKRVAGAPDALPVYAIDIQLRGADETPFFDDVTDCCANDATMTVPLEQGRTLEVGPTDRTSSQRTPALPLWRIPRLASASFAPYVENVPTPRAGENNLTRIAPGRPLADGDRVEVTGRLADTAGSPICGALVEIWNANRWGRYAHDEDPAREPLDPHFLGIGRTLTDDNGDYRFVTIKPGAYLARPDIGRWRPRHIHLSLLGKGARLITQMYFADDPYNATDPAFMLLGDARSRHVGRKMPHTSSEFEEAYAFDIVVASRCGVLFRPENE